MKKLSSLKLKESVELLDEKEMKMIQGGYYTNGGDTGRCSSSNVSLYGCLVDGNTWVSVCAQTCSDAAYFINNGSTYPKVVCC